jgi:hypothetical protein
MNSILVYTKYETTRLQFVLYELFQRRIGLKVIITDNDRHFIQSNEPIKLAYAQQKPDCDCLHIFSHDILFENAIVKQHINASKQPDWHVIFFENQAGDLPFDILSASFYLLSRYEEYLPHKTDLHGRFVAEQSIANVNGFLGIPLVDLWCNNLKEIIENKFDFRTKSLHRFKLVSTVDIDFAYRYKGIGFVRWWFKLCNSIVQFKWKDVFLQTTTFLGVKKDPYDTYDYIINTAKNNQVLLQFFYLVGCSNMKYDKNITSQANEVKSLLDNLKKFATVGLHPSYETYNNSQTLNQELNQLNQILNKPINDSRQHYLRFRLPETYDNLVANNVAHDYSMGYATHTGFRASTCKPFYYFDLKNNLTTSLTIHSPVCMDTTLRYAMKLNPHEAINHCKILMYNVQLYDGDFILIWHNSSLSDAEDWIPWKYVFEQLHIM